MQDRFKFRAWNTLVKEFSYFDKPEMQIGTGGFDNGLIFPLSENSNLYMGKYSEPQFCTGIKDKNGKLIYEGDIVKDLIIPEIFYIVKWFNGGFYLESTISGSFLKFNDTQQEVLGNIYENLELLERNNDKTTR